MRCRRSGRRKLVTSEAGKEAGVPTSTRRWWEKVAEIPEDDFEAHKKAGNGMEAIRAVVDERNHRRKVATPSPALATGSGKVAMGDVSGVAALMGIIICAFGECQ